MNYEKKYKEAFEIANVAYKDEDRHLKATLERIFPELKESEDERIRQELIAFLIYYNTGQGKRVVHCDDWISWLEKQGQGSEPNWCHHKVDLSNCSEEYLKAYYDGWNNCNMQHSQCKSEKQDEVKESVIFRHENKTCKENDDSLTSEDERIRKDIIKVFKGEISFTTEEDNKKYITWLEKQCEPQDKGEISDGYHTFNELYYYRMLYNAAFFNILPKEWVHKSKRHNDGEECFGGGWFIVMANLPTGQISNHYELKDWDLFQIPEKEVADKWDGHTPQEAADRLHKYLLEKQVSKKPADKVEPKFKNGQWIVWQDKCYKVNYNGCGYELVDQNGWSTSLGYETIDENAHIWDITKDAKDGDVLKEDSCTFIIERMKPDGTAIIHCCLFDDGNFDLGSTLIFDIDSTHPATKEQHDILFQKMKEAGYEWDAEKKELKNIEQKFSWSEDDEKMIRSICCYLNEFGNWLSDKNEEKSQSIYKACDWLKSLKKE